jgi:hypothetical protein
LRTPGWADPVAERHAENPGIPWVEKKPESALHRCRAAAGQVVQIFFHLRVVMNRNELNLPLGLVLLGCLAAAPAAQQPLPDRQHRPTRRPTQAELDQLFSPTAENLTIENCLITLNDFIEDLGDITVRVVPLVGRTVMQATFTVDPALRGVTDWVDLHWLQTILWDDAPVSFRRVPATIPIVDPPDGGWDYMYTDGGVRKTPDPAYAWFHDGMPWYYNGVGEAAKNTVGSSYVWRHST